jgi:hypothetical protein
MKLELMAFMAVFALKALSSGKGEWASVPRKWRSEWETLRPARALHNGTWRRPGHVEARWVLRSRMVSTSWPCVIRRDILLNTCGVTVWARWGSNLGRLD